MTDTQPLHIAERERELIRTTTAFAIALMIATLVLASHLGLVPIGQWRGDEFNMTVGIREEGLPYMFERLRIWSPRPVSEAFIWVYSQAILAFHRPFVSVALGAMWGLMMLCLIALPLSLRSPVKSIYLLWGTALFALFLLGQPVAQVFYWPIGAFAYMSGIAFLGAAFWLILGGLSSARDRTLCAAFLTLAAGSVEISAIFVVLFSTLALAITLFKRGGAQGLIWLIIPAAASLLVLTMLYTGRVGNSTEQEGDLAIAGHIGRSLSAALPAFGREVLAIGVPGQTGAATILGIIGRAAFAVACFGMAKSIAFKLRSAIDRRWLVAFALACFGTGLLTAAAGLYQFGMTCCERQSTFTQCLIVLGIAAAAASAGMAPVRGVGTPPKLTGYFVCLIVALVLPLRISLPKVVDDYASYQTFVDNRVHNWRAGFDGSDAMVYRLSEGRIVSTEGLLVGTFHAGDANLTWQLQKLLALFKKKTVTVQWVPTHCPGR